MWLVNIVPVPKNDGKIKICVDYRDLKKANPEDDFPLPNIYILIDNCAKHELQSFMDCFVGYHQILMHKEDAEQIAFTTPWEVYCYRVMPFSLKNAGATYMRAMTTLFHDMIHKEIEVLCKKFIKIEFKHIPKILNEFADALATLSSMIQHPDKNYIDPINIEVPDQHAYYFHVDEDSDGKPWYYDIKREVLYRRYPNLGLLRCVDLAEATKLLEEVHAGTCGPHMNNFTLAKKTLRAGYFWMTIESDSICYVQKCHQCHIHGDFIRGPPNVLNVIGLPWPFATWGLDIIRPIELVASNGHHFILNQSSFDNASNLNSDLIREICEKFRIVHRNSTAYRLQMNGAVEAANKNIKRILQNIIDNHRQWHEKLSFALLGYRTTKRTSTEATPYILVYGTKDVILTNVESTIFESHSGSQVR
ncbi:uncharacterized protein [Nicotiana tomentosiformis]|uniref:uncharacterized protein n=1 Tax=Nicotiana tomentosiformis TaxID=4098 RepID=UPI00388C49E5